MTPVELSTLHHKCFSRPRPWSPNEFKHLLESCFLVERANAFLLGRFIFDDAEILTLAVSPSERRKGVASLLVKDFLLRATKQGVNRVTLEVAEDNLPALALYYSFSFVSIGRREGYYKSTNQQNNVAALVLSCDLSLTKK